MHGVRTAEPNNARALVTAEGEAMAGRSAARLLITASTPSAVEMIARRVHAASARAEFPFVQTSAADFPIEPRTLRVTCSALLDAARGGSLFVSDIENMPPFVQGRLIELLNELESARASAALVRLVAGTTVSLFDRTAGGTFSKQLFYRLNTLHLVERDVPHTGRT
jgi:DNA-binding NtrC family response regulator